MKPQLIILNKDYGKSGQCFYHEKGFSLNYEIDSKDDYIKIDENNTVRNPWWLTHEEKSKNRLLVYDTLTIVFDSLSKSFVSFDCFTNKAQWIKKNSIDKPTISKKGLLQFCEGFEEDDRFRYNISPTFEFTSSEVLKISISDDKNSKFYNIKDNLMIGLEDYQLTSLIVSDLIFV